MNLAPEHSQRAVLIRRNGQRAVVEGLSNAQFLALIAEVGPKYFAGYILNPQNKSVADSTKAVTKEADEEKPACSETRQTGERG